MNIDEAIKALEEAKKEHGGDMPLMMNIQSGPDSWRWVNVKEMYVTYLTRGKKVLYVGEE